jgi:hypothetical protein
MSVQRVSRRRMPPKRAVRFQLRGELKAVFEIGRIEVEDGEEILPSRRRVNEA